LQRWPLTTALFTLFLELWISPNSSDYDYQESASADETPKQFVKRLLSLFQAFRLEQLHASANQKEDYDSRHPEQEFKPNQLVLVDTRKHYKQLNKNTDKLMPRWSGPFRVVRLITSNTYEL